MMSKSSLRANFLLKTPMHLPSATFSVKLSKCLPCQNLILTNTCQQLSSGQGTSNQRSCQFWKSRLSRHPDHLNKFTTTRIWRPKTSIKCIRLFLRCLNWLSLKPSSITCILKDNSLPIIVPGIISNFCLLGRVKIRSCRSA